MLRRTDLLARCGLLTTINPHTSQSVGTSHSLLPHLGHMYPPFFNKPWQTHIVSPPVGSRVGKPMIMRSPAGGGFPFPPAPLDPPAARADLTPIVLAATVCAGGGILSHMSSRR
jgi:hypothetical protein